MADIKEPEKVENKAPEKSVAEQTAKQFFKQYPKYKEGIYVFENGLLFKKESLASRYAKECGLKYETFKK